MLLVPKSIHSSCLRLSALILSLTFLQCALAQFYGPDETYPQVYDVDRSDYPSNDELRDAFIKTGWDQTVMTVMPECYRPLYKQICRNPVYNLKCVYNA